MSTYTEVVIPGDGSFVKAIDNQTSANLVKLTSGGSYYAVALPHDPNEDGSGVSVIAPEIFVDDNSEPFSDSEAMDVFVRVVRAVKGVSGRIGVYQ